MNLFNEHNLKISDNTSNYNLNVSYVLNVSKTSLVIRKTSKTEWIFILIRDYFRLFIILYTVKYVSSQKYLQTIKKIEYKRAMVCCVGVTFHARAL